MRAFLLGAIAGVSLLIAGPAGAENKMGYKLLTQEDVTTLPRNHGALGLDIERATTINDGGMVFDLIRVKDVRSGSAGGKAGLHKGDEIIALDGHVFSTLQVFAAYVGAATPGARVLIDYIPSGSGPAQAQRVTAVVAGGGQQPVQEGMSTREKVGIGIGAAALLGCYEMGCFSHKPAQGQPQQGQMQQQPVR